MRKILTAIGQVIPRSKARRISVLMEMTDEERIIWLYRCCGDHTMLMISESPYYITVQQQRRIMRLLNAKVQSWVLDNKAVFNDFEFSKFAHLLPK